MQTQAKAEIRIRQRRFTVDEFHRMAEAGIAEFWLVDLNANVIERHTEPSDDGYRLLRRAGRGEMLESVVLPTITIPVDAALG